MLGKILMATIRKLKDGAEFTFKDEEIVFL